MPSSDIVGAVSMVGRTLDAAIDLTAVASR